MAVKTKKRESNIELLRIICMMLIIAHHTVLHGGGINMEFCANKWFAIFLVPGGKICFNTFLAISMWFLVDQQFKAERFIKLWLETLFYSVLISYVAYLFGVAFTSKDIFSIFLPITGNVHGFAAAYLIVYALIPFLNLVARKINKTQLKFLLFVLFTANVFSLIIGNYTMHFQKIYSNVGFWIFCYFLSLYLKKYPPAFLTRQSILIFIFVSCWLVLVGLYAGKALYPNNEFIKYLFSISTSHTAVVCIIGGYSLFFIFKNIKLPYCSVVNLFAKTTFAVLMIHDHNFFRTPLWQQVIKAPEWWYSRYYPVRVLLTVLFIFFICALFDLLRIYLLERNIFKSNKLKQVFAKIDSVCNIQE